MRRASRDIEVYREECVGTPAGFGMPGIDSPGESACPHRDYDFRLRHGLVGFQHGFLHIPGDRPRDNQAVRVTGGRRVADAETVQIEADRP